MPNIASTFKSEMSRVARKEVRVETQALKKASAAYRSDIAALKRRTAMLEQQMRRLLKNGSSKIAGPVAKADGDPTSSEIRFSGKGFASLRGRLGLSVANAARLLGTSSQSIYNWEEGKIRPRASYLPGIAVLKSSGKKEVKARLAALG